MRAIPSKEKRMRGKRVLVSREWCAVRYDVPPEAQGLTLGRYLYDRLGLSRSLVRRAKNGGAVLVDGRPARMNDLLRGGERIELIAPVQGKVAPEPIPLAVVYEDDHLLVVDKPAGMVVHPVKDYTGGTLANAVAHHLLERGEEPVARPVQRIDRETSGLVLFAKDPAMAGQLAGALERHKLDRQYLAVVHGQVGPDKGTIDVPIRRVWGHPVAREAAVGPRTPEQEALLAQAAAAGQVLKDEWTAAGQAAVTHFEVLQRWEAATLLSLRLETGRTHQIRVHMAYLGHPLLGDSLYGCGGEPGRQALHAATLAFQHPMTGERMRFESPLPPDLVALVERLNAGWRPSRT
jgi:23S rRNA pseudouridine1911/1915/1917 synthase